MEIGKWKMETANGKRKLKVENERLKIESGKLKMED